MNVLYCEDYWDDSIRASKEDDGDELLILIMSSRDTTILYSARTVFIKSFILREKDHLPLVQD